VHKVEKTLEVLNPDFSFSDLKISALMELFISGFQKASKCLE
jgi:hypothetical protein